MGPDMFLSVPRVGNPGFPPSPIPKTSKISRGAGNQPWHRSDSSQPHSRQDSKGQEALQIFFHFLDLFGQNC